jgi:endoglucanase
LDVGAKRSRDDPFGAGAIYNDFDAAPHTFGLISTARLYASLTDDTTYASFATTQRDWALGANPWGVSLMIGVGSVFAQCPQHVVANLSGSVDGQPPILRGAVVNGPNSADLFKDGLGEFFAEGKTCPADGVDRYAAFNARGSQFVDDVRSWQTVEPAIDFTAAALLAFSLLH